MRITYVPIRLVKGMTGIHDYITLGCSCHYDPWTQGAIDSTWTYVNFFKGHEYLVSGSYPDYTCPNCGTKIRPESGITSLRGTWKDTVATTHTFYKCSTHGYTGTSQYHT